MQKTRLLPISTQLHMQNFVKWVLPELLKTTSDIEARNQIRAAMRSAASNRIEDLITAVRALDVTRIAKRVFVNKQAADDAGVSIQSLARASKQYSSTSAFLKGLLSHDYQTSTSKLAKERILLSSIEAAKGLEFEHVIVPDVNQGAFDGESADERNLFYVAASRARQLLTLTHRPGRASSYLRVYSAS